ncbi:hypothetical protein SteCoe_8646 [Stentor coeruleus]|uniref:Uncharacterized protein n=1 Tax=Stentor coeruleus TaxID=5963 RepID=A0A1R2CJR9_9CILI|nr:hypothetical protein SteCoe_8646 [Stentor coeruleus]
MDNPVEYATFPYDEASWFDDLFLRWVFPMAKYFRSKPPSMENMIKLPDRLHYDDNFKKVNKAWKKESLNKNPNIFNALWTVLKKEYLLANLPGIISYNFMILSSLMIVYIVNYINNNNEPVSHIVGYIIAYSIFVMIISLGINRSFIMCYFFTAKLKGILTQMIFEKSLKTYLGEISQGDQIGKITSLVSADVEFFEGLVIMPFFFAMPTFFIGSGILLGFNLGASGIVGLLVAIFHFPLIYYFGKVIGKYRYLTSAIGDARMKMITNLIEGIRIVKLYGWEHPYLESLFNKRQLEINQYKKKALVSCFYKSINYGSMGLVLFVTFSMYIALGNKLEAGTSFSSIAILILCTSMVSLIGTAGIMQVFLLIIAMKRITQSLLMQERTKIEFETCSEKYSLQVRHCTFMWKEPEKTKNDESEMSTIRESKTIWSLNNLNFKCKPGELIIVIGSVGSGKSALFMGLLREIFLAEGEVKANGRISLASEEPWIISGTIKQNILMGLGMDEEWYDKVTTGCCLDKDFEQFNEYRDETIVGDRGITLSGGQKARVSLARAVYANREIILLDDPLSAVDPEVCSKLFHDCIKGVLADKTVILATHQAHFVSHADKVMILDDGKQIFFGTYEELIEGGFSSYLGKLSQNKKAADEEVVKKIETKEYKRSATQDIKSIQVEERAKGNVPFKIYWRFLMFGYYNWFIILLCTLLQCAAQVSYLSIIYWIAYWSSAPDQENSKYILGMGILVIILYIFTFFRTYVMNFPLIKSSQKLHNQALSGLAYTKSVFFDQNPTGRMLNRFSKDTSLMDETLVMTLGECVTTFTLVFGNFIVIVIINPYILIALAVMVTYFIILTRYLARINKDLKVLDLTTKSPIISLLNTSIHGLSTIRCLDLSHRLKREMRSSIGENLKSYISFQVIFRGIQMYLDIGPNIMNVVNIIVLVLIKDTMTPGLAGMSISLTITIMGYVGYLFRIGIDTDNNMASPQRLFEYQKLEPEGDHIKDGSFKISKGKIEVRELYMKYRENYDFALKGLNFTIQPGMKTGIIGRTGAGKSSIMQVLFRLTNPQQGTIFIDGQDYLKAGLHELRKQMSVIPQTATLFIASLKDNLDPFHEHSDDEIKKVLGKVRLGGLLDHLPKGLESQINSKGLSLSAGQKQLVCLARAILRRNKIVMIDEATANVDSETDEFIQSQLMKRFKNSTLLIVAHRLRTVIESDWMVVMDEGKTLQEGHPRDLIKEPDSLLMKMIKHTGQEESEYLLSKLVTIG